MDERGSSLVREKIPETCCRAGPVDPKALARGPMHGYGVAEWIHQMSEDVLRIEEGALYPALHRLELRGWLSPEWGTSDNNRRARFYALTTAGRKQLAQESEYWRRRMSGAIA